MRTHAAFVSGGDRMVRRVILLVLDGLRPDAIERFGMTRLAALARRGAATLNATTVSPSVTAACMASLFTGVSPDRHGVNSSRFQIGRPREKLAPVPQVLDGAALESEAFMARVPWFMTRIARQIAKALHVNATFAGRESLEVLGAALPRLHAKRDGLMILHWPDGDDAGHRHGWMSSPYEQAVRRMDAALGGLIEAASLFESSDTMLIVMADHGGGGAVANDHDSAHPLDRTIPIIFAGGGVAPRTLPDPVSLLDVPPTILWALGAPIPQSYRGRPLMELFTREAAVA
jgi:predicted AlkP superfamily pyrophosphatase or phosphodiesterase